MPPFAPPPPPPPVQPCIGQGVSLDFQFAYLLYNNLGGRGPDTGVPASMRFANVGVVYHPVFGAIYFDIDLTTTTSYTPGDVLSNGFVNNKFAQVNLACGQSVGLRATLRRSCASAPSCRACEDPSMDTFTRISCYAAGCDCIGATVYTPDGCTTSAVTSNRASYSCAQMNDAIMLPSSALVSLTVYDLDASTDGLHRSLTLDRLDLERLQHWDGAGVFLLERLFRGACSGHQRRSGRRERLCDRRRRVGGGRVAPRLASVREQESRSGGRGAKFCSLSLSQFVGHFGPAS